MKFTTSRERAISCNMGERLRAERDATVSHAIVDAQPGSPCEPNSLYDSPDDDPRLLLVSPNAISALWSAVWALEDSLSAVQRIRALTSPPPYAADMVEQMQSQLNLLRDLLGTLRGGAPPVAVETQSATLMGGNRTLVSTAPSEEAD